MCYLQIKKCSYKIDIDWKGATGGSFSLHESHGLISMHTGILSGANKQKRLFD